MKRKIPRILIAAPHSGTGKTLFTIGIMAALSKRGMQIQPYKVGPDYIDTAFHTYVTKNSSINLDGWMLKEHEIKRIFLDYSTKADLSIVEGVMGLYDGVNYDPFVGSSAGISKLLDIPVILVMQAKGMSTTAAAILQGLKEFGDVNIAGVVINQPSSINHYQSLKKAVEMHTSIKILGYLPYIDSSNLKSRHLGLIQSCEIDNLDQIIEELREKIEEYIDVNQIIEISQKASSLYDEETIKTYIEQPKKIKIAVAYDQAFRFYYHENFKILERLGVELHFFSPLKDRSLPKDCCGLYIGGGYPELFAEQLEANVSLRKQIYDRAQHGIPIYAECGGYMYLNKHFIDRDGKKYEFVGLFDGESQMTERLQNFGYAEIETVSENFMFSKGQKVRAHEFHKSIILRKEENYCVKVTKNRDGNERVWNCGMQKENVFAMYPHLYFPSCQQIAENFVNQCIEFYQQQY